MRTYPQWGGPANRQRTMCEVQYGQAKQRQVDSAWKWALLWIGIFICFPNAAIVGFVMTIMYVSAGSLKNMAIVMAPTVILPVVIVLAMKAMGYA